MSEAVSKQWRAVTIKGSPLIRVKAADEEKAVLLASKELSRPGRETAKAAWEKGGMKLVEIEEDEPRIVKAKATMKPVVRDKVAKVSVAPAPAAKTQPTKEPSSVELDSVDDEAELEIVDVTDIELDIFTRAVEISASDTFMELLNDNFTKDNVQKIHDRLVLIIENEVPHHFKKGDKVTVDLKSWEGFVCTVENIWKEKATVSIEHSRAGKKSYNTKTKNLRVYHE